MEPGVADLSHVLATEGKEGGQKENREADSGLFTKDTQISSVSLFFLERSQR